MKFLGSTDAAAESEARIFPSHYVIFDTQWTFAYPAAATNIPHIPVELDSLPRCLRMTLVTEMRQVIADESSDVATEAALVVDIKVSVLFLLACRIAEA